MRTWKIVLVGTILSTALIFTIVRHAPNASERVANNAPVASQPASLITSPIVPAAIDTRDPGPIRPTDW